MGHPTYDEFKHAQAHSKEFGYVVKTADSRLFFVENGTFIQAAGTAIRIFSVLAVATVMFSMSLSDTKWPMFLIDNALFPILVSSLTSRLLYRRARFRELEPDSNEFKTFEDEKFGKPPDRLLFILMGMGLLFLFLNSFTFTYLRSLIYDEARVTSVEVNGEAFTNINDETPAVFHITPASGDSGFILRVTTACTPEEATVTADGEPIWSHRIPYFSFFWQKDYFSQEQNFSISHSLIRDGSTLTLTCGNLVREWVFDVADKEGA